MLDALLTALENVAAPEVLLAILLSAAYGIFVGSIPGLTATMAVALVVPITFFLDDVTALAAIVTLEACSIFAGDIPTTLVRIPGTPSSAAYVDDAYSLTRAGLHERALRTALLFSVAGGLFGAVILMGAAPQLANVAFQFTTYEYFWLYVLGLSCAAIVSHGSRVKGALALVIGLLLSTVGLSEVHSVPRFTFGQDELISGVNFIPAMIGLFGVSEVLRNTLTAGADGNGGPPASRRRQLAGPYPEAGASGSPEEADASGSHGNSYPGPTEAAILSEDQGLEEPAARADADASLGSVVRHFWRRKWHALRSCLTGAVVGMIPGAGADIGAWISYAVSKRSSDTPEEYGQGSLDGLADATAANNSALAGAWIPSLVFGIPGDSVTAIVIGVLLMKNITPGPDIFTDPQQSPLVYGIYISFLLANLLLVPIGLLAVRTGSLLVRIPRRVLMPVILVFCVLGSYAIGGSYFDVWVMLAMGVLGFVLEWFGVPLGPVVLGIILGGKVEQTFVQNLTKSDSLWAFFGQPIAAGLGVACLALWFLPPVMRAIRKVRQ